MKKLLLALTVLVGFFFLNSGAFAACPAAFGQFKDNAGSTFNMALTSDANGNCVAKADWDTNSQAHTDMTAPVPCKGFTTSTTQTPVSSGTVTPAGCDLNGNLYVNAASTGVYFTNVASSVLTRPADTTQYTANTTVCASKSASCTPLTIAIGATNAGKGLINRVSLLKSGSTTTSANFTIWFFSAAPGLATPTQEDNVAYAGPRAGDMPNYIGNAVCSTPVATSDTSAQVWYDCTLSNPNTAGALDFQALSGSTNIDALISVTATYTPVSAETFTVYASGIY